MSEPNPPRVQELLRTHDHAPEAERFTFDTEGQPEELSEVKNRQIKLLTARFFDGALPEVQIQLAQGACRRYRVSTRGLGHAEDFARKLLYDRDIGDAVARAAALSLMRPIDDFGTRSLQDSIHQHRVFRIVEFHDLGRPREEAGHHDG